MEHSKILKIIFSLILPIFIVWLGFQLSFWREGFVLTGFNSYSILFVALGLGTYLSSSLDQKKRVAIVIYIPIMFVVLIYTGLGTVCINGNCL